MDEEEDYTIYIFYVLFAVLTIMLGAMAHGSMYTEPFGVWI